MIARRCRGQRGALDQDRIDAQLGEVTAIPRHLAQALLGLVLEDAQLPAAAVGHHRGGDAHALEILAVRGLLAGSAGEEQGLERHHTAHLGGEAVDEEAVTGAHPILAAAVGEDGVHDCS